MKFKYINTMPVKNKKLNAKPKPLLKNKVAAKPKVSTKPKGLVRNSQALMNYKAALTSPFSAMAMGARVPDQFMCPTISRHITRTYTMRTNSQGEFDLIVLPNLYNHVISPRGNIVNGSTWSTLSGSDVTTGADYTSYTVLSAQLTNYRIVGYGVKVFGLASMTNNSGKVLIATVPVSTYVNDRTTSVGGQTSNSTNSSATVGYYLEDLSIPSSSNLVDISSIPQMVNSIETSTVNLSERPIEVIPKLTSPEAFIFKQAKDSLGYGLTQQTSLVSVTAGDPSYLRVAGHEAVVVCGTGMTATSNTIEVEVIYHFEGSPAVTLTGAKTIGNDSAVNHCDPVNWIRIMADAATSATFRSAAASLVNTYYPGLGTAVNRFMG